MMIPRITDLSRAPRIPVLAVLLSFGLPAMAQAQMVSPPAPRLQLDVPYVPTPTDVVARMLEMGDVGEEDFVIDLGSGDGRIAIAAVKERGAKGALGVDLNPERIHEARENAQKADVTDKVTFERQNLFDTDLGKATVITMYLLEAVNAKLRPTLLGLEPGTRIVSHAFSLGDWEPDQQADVGGRVVYMWTVPARVDGRWTLTDGEERLTLDLKQSFQKVEANATAAGKPMAVKDVKLSGDLIELTLEGSGGARTFTGTVNGNAITPAGGSATWKAARG